MYYVLRTHGEIESHWGFTAIAMAATKQDAVKKAKELFTKTFSNDKLVIVKAVSLIKYAIPKVVPTTAFTIILEETKL